MKRISVIFSAIVLSLAACSPAVYTSKAADADFGTYETYAMLPSGENTEGTEANTIYTDKIINEVNQEMRSRGYRLDNQNPDLLVNVKTMYEEEEELVTTNYYPATYDYYTPGFYSPAALDPYYYTGYAGIAGVTGPGIREVEYTQGTFVVDVIEAKGENQVVWRGWSETPVDPADLDDSIREYVDNIYEEYPVEKVEEN